MAERLYRGKPKNESDRKHYGSWVHGYYCPTPFGRFPAKPAIYPKKATEAGNFEPIEIIPDTLGQETTITDKNKVMIFEGDIIEWDPKEWGCQYKEAVKWDYELFDMKKNEWPEFCEVVGNIYDNPELLEVK